MGNAEYMGVLVPRLPEQHSPLLVDSYTHELKQQHKMPNKGSKKAKKSGSNIFSLFSQKQIQEFKEAFGIIDNDKDGIITAPDLKKAFEGIGRPISDGEANNMVGEAPGPINFTQMVTLFAEKISSNEIDDAFREFKIDGGMIDAEHLKSIMVAKNKSLSQRISSRQEKRLRPKMGLFLDSQENATCDKISFGKQAPTSINNQLLGQSQNSPQEILCIKNVSESEPINETSRAS